MTNVLRNFIAFPPTERITRETTKRNRGQLGISATCCFGQCVGEKIGKLSTGYASGWMAFRGARRRRAVDRAFVLSDHADWSGLLRQ